MVRIENNKLIIEIESNSPIDDLERYQRGIIRALQSLRLESEDTSGYEPVYHLTDLLGNLLLDFDQMKKGLSNDTSKEK